MVRWAERLLHLRAGDLARGTPLFLYLFFIISTYVMGQAARDALFLELYENTQLPYVDISISVLVGVVMAGYIRLARQTSLIPLLAGCLSTYAGVAFFFWWAFSTYRWAWLAPALYIWIGIFGVLAIAQVWTLANFLLTTREAKRFFGIVGGGGILGGIVGGFVAGQAEVIGTENLLLVISAVLALCVGLVLFIARQHGEGDVGLLARAHATRESPGNLRESLGLILESRQLRSIALLICVGSVVTTAAGWQFKSLAKEFLPDTDQLAAFYGMFNMYAGLISFPMQFLVTSRLLQRFGIGMALLVLPAALTMGTVGVLIWGNLLAVTLLRGGDKIFRYSIDTASLQLLYLPVATEIKLQVKSFIDTIIWRLGDGLAGLVLLIFATWIGLTPREVGWVALLLLGAWILLARQARREYLASLSARLEQHRIDSDQANAPVLDRSTTTMLAEKLSSPNTEEVLYGLSLFDAGYHQAAHPAMRGLIHHSSSEVRARALSILSAAGDTGVAPEVEGLLGDKDLGVRTEALSYLTRHAHVDPLERIREPGDFPEAAIRSAVIAFLARPGEAQNLEAARMMVDSMLDERGEDGQTARHEAALLVAREAELFESQLSRLLEDADPRIVQFGLEGASRLPRLGFVPRILECLGTEDIREASKNALVQYGDRIVGTLNDYLKDPHMPLEVRREIPGILVSIGTNDAQRALVDNLLQGDADLRFRIISALNKFRQDHPGIELDRQLVETVLVAEVLGHYRSYQAFSALEAKLGPQDPALEAFRDSLAKEVERVFRLLGLLYPEHNFHAVHAGLGSGNLGLQDNALEFLDSVLRPEMRSLLVPLVDGGISIEERTRRAAQLIGQEVTTSEDAVRMLVSSGDPWLRSCAAYAIGKLGLRDLRPELDQMQEDTDPLLTEAVRQARRLLTDMP